MQLGFPLPTEKSKKFWSELLKFNLQAVKEYRWWKCDDAEEINYEKRAEKKMRWKDKKRHAVADFYAK